jgi:hypothetical protein
MMVMGIAPTIFRLKAGRSNYFATPPLLTFMLSLFYQLLIFVNISFAKSMACGKQTFDSATTIKCAGLPL